VNQTSLYKQHRADYAAQKIYQETIAVLHTDVSKNSVQQERRKAPPPRGGPARWGCISVYNICDLITAPIVLPSYYVSLEINHFKAKKDNYDINVLRIRIKL
jgi:hypothetical protein